MLARAIWKDGTPIDMVLPDVSEPFVVILLTIHTRYLYLRQPRQSANPKALQLGQKE